MSSANSRDPSKWVVMSSEFQKWLGIFHGMHSTLDLTVDFAIWQFLKVTSQEAHLITELAPQIRTAT